MRVFRFVVMCLAVLLAQGCMASTVVLHVRPDFSGRATITTRLYLSGMRAFDGIFAAQGIAPPRPPQVEEELPAPTEGSLRMAFGTNVKVASTRLDAATDGGIRTTEVDFDDIRKLQMPFPPVFAPGGSGRDFSLAMSGVTEAALMTFAIRPHENGDRLLVVKLPNPRVSNEPDAPVTTFETDSQEERLIKQAIKNMRAQLFVEIEPPVLRTNAPRQEGSRVTILDLDLDRMINAMDEPRVRRMMSPGSFQEMLWQVGDLPGAIIPTETEVLLEYEGPPQQAPPPSAPPAAQAPPDTEIYLAPLKSVNGQIALEAPANMTNHPGYDNQPFFTPDGRGILFASARTPTPAMRENPNLPQTDIWRYDIASKSVSRVTQTPENEFSPTPMLDGVRISAVTVEADGTQRLYAIAPSGSKIQRDVILPDVKPVGYHAWADDHTLALFVLGGGQGMPATLQLADTKTGAARVVATDIGRSVQRMPGSGAARHISFVQRERRGDAVTLIIKELDPATGAVTTLTPAVEGSREADLAWTPDGTLLMVKDDVLYAWTRGQSTWKEAASFKQWNVRGVSRLAVSPKGDVIALVATASPSER
jgi:WD40-like Beta Propeller Repeat